MDVKSDLRIDKNNLDGEWERQAELIYEYSESLANAQKKLDELRLAYDVNCANVKNNVRGYGEIVINGKKVKITENALVELITIDDGLVAQRKEIVEAEHTVDVLKGAVEALRNKKTALEWESQLYLTGYYGEPKTNATQIRQRGNN